jgi:hypothetical protein
VSGYPESYFMQAIFIRTQGQAYWLTSQTGPNADRLLYLLGQWFCRVNVEPPVSRYSPPKSLTLSSPSRTLHHSSIKFAHYRRREVVGNNQRREAAAFAEATGARAFGKPRSTGRWVLGTNPRPPVKTTNGTANAMVHSTVLNF